MSQDNIIRQNQIIDLCICKNCNNQLQINDAVCYNCGLETGYIEYSNYNFEETENTQCKKMSPKNNRITKIQDWFTWTSQEKNEYKLSKYTREFCQNLNNLCSDRKSQIILSENIIEQLVIFVSEVMKAIKDDFNGPKRSKVKDGLIIMCIYYVLKSNEIYASYIDISKTLNIEMKYISSGNKTINHLINNGKLKIKGSFKDLIFKTEKPIDYIKKVINKYSLSVDSSILNQVSDLINICEDNDVLLDHTPLSIGVSCFYYILLLNSLEIDIKLFSELYSISIVTIDKTFKKLLTYKQQFEKMGILSIQ